VLRQFKPLLRTIAGHARRHRDRLAKEYANTPYTQAQAGRIIGRIDRMLEQVPRVIEQAHERIIGERPVPNAQAAQRPRAGHAGDRARQSRTRCRVWPYAVHRRKPQGLILDWQLYRQQAPAEWRQLQDSVERQNDFDLPAPIAAVGADRGFCARQGAEQLAQDKIYDAVCPRDPQELAQRFKEKRFAGLQRRRGSTEARIAIVKQRQGRRLRSRGFDHRYLAVAWSVLGHNL
jgi:hypothetical protein